MDADQMKAPALASSRSTSFSTLTSQGPWKATMESPWIPCSRKAQREFQLGAVVADFRP